MINQTALVEDVVLAPNFLTEGEIHNYAADTEEVVVAWFAIPEHKVRQYIEEGRAVISCFLGSWVGFANDKSTY